MIWDIKYANDANATIRVSGDFAKAERIAVKRNKYSESFTITEALKQDLTFEKEQALLEAIKYGCSTQGMR